MWRTGQVYLVLDTRTDGRRRLSKPRLFVQGTTGELRWRHGEVEHLWIIEPSLQIAEGTPEVVTSLNDHTRQDIIARGVR